MDNLQPGNPGPSIEELNRLIESQPNNAELYWQRGTLWANTHNDQRRAIGDYDQAIRLKADQPVYYFYRARSHILLSQFDAALTDYNRALELDPDQPDLYASRAACYSLMREYSKALDDYEWLIHHQPAAPAFAAAYNGRAYAFYQLGKPREALADSELAVGLAPQVETYRLYRDFYRQLVEKGPAASRVEPCSTHADYYLHQAKYFYGQQEHRQAIELCTLALEHEPQAAPIILFRGLVYNVLGLRQAALDDFNRYLEFNPAERTMVHYYRALAYRGMDNFEKALSELDAALQLAPNQPDFIHERGQTLLRQYRYAEALPDLKRAWELQPANPRFKSVYEFAQAQLKKGDPATLQARLAQLLEQGAAQEKAGDWQAALDSYIQAARLDPVSSAANHAAGLLLFKKGYYKQAIPFFDDVLNWYYQDEIAWSNRSSCHYLVGNYQEALRDAQMAIQIDPSLSLAYAGRANAYTALGEFEKALVDYDRALELNPNQFSLHCNRANLYKTMGEYQQAIADYSRELELNPDYADAYQNRATTYTEIGNLEAALADYQRLVELEPDVAESYGWRGFTYQQLERYTEAIADFDQAIMLDQKTARYYIGRATSYAALGNWQKALADHDQIIRLEPTANSYFMRGMVYVQVKDRKSALADLDKAIELDPDQPQYHQLRDSLLKG